MVSQDYWKTPVSDNITVEQFQIQPLEVEYPSEDELTADELRSRESKIVWAGIMAVYLIVVWHYRPSASHTIEVWCIAITLFLSTGVFISAIATILLNLYHTRKVLQKKYALKKRSAWREAAIRTRFATEALHKLHRHNGYTKARVFQLERSSKQLRQAFDSRRFLSFERKFRDLISEYRKIINRLLKYQELELEFEELIKDRVSFPDATQPLPDPPEFPLLEVLQIRSDFDELIEMIDQDASFATIIVILKSTDRQLDPAIILRKMKKKHRA
ncbi:hypothetical protein [Neolewinella agarilytica]|uniref:Uncharacterized protein n=1 Tax=Neolewinella agarilytica TaxID=478744 RepID=A0A1H9D2S3_9BACT|nr:hypothetical protein [Neolewinella agarilytica]SEQ07755.1 hypothetical protein SAMN05444359_105123 [Neolewinella agarilytica]